MKKILIPTASAEDWKALLAQPELHWKAGASAMAAALSWEAANGMPEEIASALNSGPAVLQNMDLILALPEWQVPLPGGRRPSHTDVMAIATNEHGLAIIAVEAKVEEPFGPTLGEKREAASDGQEERLRFLHATLGLWEPVSNEIRYQLLHRTASAILMAQRFHARSAVMLIQSFSPESTWFEDYSNFAKALGVEARKDGLAAVPHLRGPELYLGWCSANERYRLSAIQETA